MGVEKKKTTNKRLLITVIIVLMALLVLFALYSEILGNTKYSLCPRGTGPSTIRLWESLAMGSVPVIVSDFLKMPMELEIDPMWLQVPENFNISSLDAIASANKKLDNKPYFDMFSNDNLYKSIVGHL